MLKIKFEILIIIELILLLPKLNANHLHDKITVYPHIVSENGIFQTNDLLEYKNYLISNKFLNIEFEFQNKKLQAKLELNQNFYNKTSVVQYKNSNLTSIKKSDLNKERYSCHFHGSIKNYNNSYTAISLCYGMVNLLNFFLL